MITRFIQTYTSGSHGVLRWEQLDAIWHAVHNGDDAWYAYEIGADVPAEPLDAESLATFIKTTDLFLHQEHDADYCGVVYVDDIEAPSLLKIYHPRKMGASCGSSGDVVLPKWTLSTERPIDLLEWAAQKDDKPSWWAKMLRVD